MLWVQLFFLHRDRIFQIPHLDRPLEFYTSWDLERLVLRWVTAASACKMILCKNRRLDDVIIQTREIRTQTVACMQLVAGGRWLLTATRHGSVDYFDLDAAPCKRVPLISSQFSDGAESCLFMTVDIVEEAPVFSFNLAIFFIQTRLQSSLPNPFKKPSPRTQEAQVWRVVLLPDNQLSAVKLVSFPLDPNIVWIHSFSLCGPRLALGIQYHNVESELNCYTLIVNWRDISQASLDYPRLCFSQKQAVSVFICFFFSCIFY